MGIFHNKQKICITFQRNDFGDTRLFITNSRGEVDWRELSDKDKRKIAIKIFKNLNIDDYEYFLKWFVQEVPDVHVKKYIKEGSEFVNGNPVREQLVWFDKVWINI